MRNERAWPNNVEELCKLSNIVVPRFGDHGTKEMLGVFGWKVWPVSNLVQQHTTTSTQYICHAISFMSYDVSDLEMFPISQKVMPFFFIPSTNFRFCFKPRKTLNGSQETLLGSFLWLPFWISLPLPAIVEIPPPALSSPISRTPPTPCFPGLPPPCPPPQRCRVTTPKLYLGVLHGTGSRGCSDFELANSLEETLSCFDVI